MRNRPVLAALLLTAALASPAFGQCSTASPVKPWQCWEGSLSVTTPANFNLYRDLRVKIAFTKGSKTRSTFAFWNGGTTSLKFRMSFPESGSWGWTASCDPSCPAGVTIPPPAQGSVTVDPAPTVGNDLQTRGYPLVETTGVNARQAFKFPDAAALNPIKKAFFWLGDTAWPGPTLASDAEWTSYLADRKGKGFSVVQVALPVDWMADRTGLPAGAKPCQNPRQPKAKRNNADPFTVTASCPLTNPFPKDCSLWNPAYWNEFDRRIQQANDQGFVVVVVGLMEGVLEAEPLANNKCRFCPPPIAVSKVYARNVAARLAGYQVILSPGFDRYSGSNKCSGDSVTSRITTIGAELRATVPHLLLTNHWASYAQAQEMLDRQSDTWLDFQLFQSGQAGQEANPDTQRHLLLFRARDLPTRLRTATPKKPSINGEAIYDAACHDDLGRTQYNAANVRQTAYWAWLAGAAGYTYGAQGLYEWGKDQNRVCGGQTMALTPTTGAALASSRHMKILKANLANVEVARLGPDANRIKNAAGVVEHQRGLAGVVPTAGAAASLTEIAAYLPQNAPSLTVNVAGLTNFACWTKQWFDPRNDVPPVTAKPSVTSATEWTFPRSANDWLLILKKAACRTATMQVWSGLAGVEGEETSAIFVEVLDANGDPVAKPVEISDPADLSEKSSPRIAFDADGTALVVWKETDSEGEPATLVARALDPDGQPRGLAVALASATVDTGAAIDVVATGTRQFVAAWEATDELTGEESLVARFVDPDGQPGTVVTLHTGAMPSDQPTLAADGHGRLALLWNQTYDENGNVYVAARYFDTAGEPQGDELAVSGFLLEGTSHAVASAKFGAFGNLTVTYDHLDETRTLTAVVQQAVDAGGSLQGDPVNVWTPEGGGSF